MLQFVAAIDGRQALGGPDLVCSHEARLLHGASGDTVELAPRLGIATGQLGFVELGKETVPEQLGLKLLFNGGQVIVQGKGRKPACHLLDAAPPR